MENINELVKYDITDAVIAKYREECMALTIKGIDDKQGYQEVNDARLFIKGERVSVEKTRKQLKEDSLTFGRAVDAEAKRITAGLTEIEEHLESEKKKIDDELASRKFEAEQRAKLPERIKTLTDMGEIMSEEEYGRYEAELLKLDDAGFAALVNRLTADKLQRQADEQARKDREQKAAQDKLDEERRRLEADKAEAERERKHQAEIEQAKKDAAENARLDAEREAQRKAQQEYERVEAGRRAIKAAKLEAERLEAERPDTEKLKSLAAFFETGIPYPNVSSKRAVARVIKVRKMVGEIIEELKAA